ncbi:MAG: hypothetical protein U1G05_00355 [Kiritimatiellia bacterium]
MLAPPRATASPPLPDLPRRELHSRLFRVRFGSSDNGPAPDGRPLHAEGAML